MSESAIERIFAEEAAMEEDDIYVQGEAAAIARHLRDGYGLCPIDFEACANVMCIWKCELWKADVVRATFPC